MKFLGVVFFVLLSGCSSNQPVSRDVPQLEISIPSFVNSDLSRVKIGIVRTRSFLASAIHYWPSVNQKVISGILTGDYIEYKLPKGEYEIGAYCFGGWSKTWKHKSVVIDSSKDKYYFSISPVGTDGENCLVIEELNFKQYMNLTAESRKLGIGMPSSR